MLLYANDLITTGGTAKLVIRSLNVPKENDCKAILYPNTQSRIINNTSYLFLMGRALFGVKGSFSVRTFYWTLGARGTEFEVRADPDNNATLSVLDGIVDASLLDAEGGRRAQRKMPGTLEVKSLGELSLTVPTTPVMRPRSLTAAQVNFILSLANEVILESQPFYPARRVFPHFGSPLERSAAFQSARFNAIWHKLPGAFEVLGNVYSDWGEGAKALEAYNKELSLNPVSQNSVSLLTNLGESYRLLGELDKAEQLLTKALGMNQRWAPALNALGNVYLDKAIIAHRNEDLDTAKRLLQYATDVYHRSFGSVERAAGDTQNRQFVEGISTFDLHPSVFRVSNLTDIDAALAYIFPYRDKRVALESSVLRKAYFETFDSGAGFKDSVPFIGWESLIQNDRGLKAIWQISPEQQNQSRGVTKVNIGDAKTLLADIAQKENQPKEAVRLYQEAQQAYLEAKEFYPQYPYAYRGLSTVRQALQALLPPSVPTQPSPRVETPQSRQSKLLDVPTQKGPPGDNALSTATSIAAVISYLGDSEIEPCLILSLMNDGTDCCDQRRIQYCSNNTSSGIAKAVQRFGRFSRLTADVTGLIGYDEIVRWIDRGLPMVVLLDDAPTLIISGYKGPNELYVLDPFHKGEMTISYRQLVGLGWGKTIRFHDRVPETKLHPSIARTANEMVEMFLNEDFYKVTEKFTPDLKRTITARMLEEGWEKFVAPLGPLFIQGEPRIRPEKAPLEVYVRCRFQKGVVYLAINFDVNGRVNGLRLLPENQGPHN